MVIPLHCSLSNRVWPCLKKWQQIQCLVLVEKIEKLNQTGRLLFQDFISELNCQLLFSFIIISYSSLPKSYCLSFKPPLRRYSLFKTLVYKNMLDFEWVTWILSMSQHFCPMFPSIFLTYTWIYCLEPFFVSFHTTSFLFRVWDLMQFKLRGICRGSYRSRFMICNVVLGIC